MEPRVEPICVPPRKNNNVLINDRFLTLASANATHNGPENKYDAVANVEVPDCASSTQAFSQPSERLRRKWIGPCFAKASSRTVIEHLN